jgi:hypothetical protein
LAIAISCVAKLKIYPTYSRNMFALYRPGIAADRSAQREVGRMKTPSRETAAKFEDAGAAEAAKTARLRALRLAKEAADRDAEQSAAATAPRPSRAYALPVQIRQVTAMRPAKSSVLN